MSATPDQSFSVVGIGASAGGITALQTLLKALPSRSNLAFVIVQHRLPDPRSELLNLLRKWSAMPIQAVSETAPLERDCAYIVTPGHSLTVERGMLVARPLIDTGARAGLDSVDTLFESMARELGARAIAVVLSGTGADGAAGAVRVRQAGGMVFVQDPTTAMHAGMPSAAIAIGAADQILPLGALAEELLACASPSYVRPSSPRAWADDVTRAFDGIVEQIRTGAGLDLTGYKSTPLLWRIQRRMQLRGVPRFRDYEALLLDEPTELDALVRGIRMHVTEFFRDPVAWCELLDVAIRSVLREAGARTIRVWIPGCATGEEAFSLAMLLSEAVEASDPPIEFQVFATDASAEIVARASRGSFAPRRVATLSPERRERFFYVADNTLRVKRTLREKMVFSARSLLVDAPFSGLDIISCRNLLSHLEPEAALRVVYLLNSSLRRGGYLFLGLGDSLPAEPHGFELVSASAQLYRKIDDMAEVRIELPKRASLADALRPSGSELGSARANADDAAPGLDWREALRLSNEELEASRDELTALNEELRASNEQLNLFNAELNLVNERLSAKLVELETQSTVLSAGAIMTLFLDRERRVRWFTDAILELFPLRATDIGRPITAIEPFADERFMSDVSAVMHAGEMREAEVCTDDDRWFLRRMRPHLSKAQVVTGVAVTFTDITERKRAELAQRQSEERQAFLLALSDALRPLGDPIEIQHVAMRVLGEHLRVARAQYFEADASGEYVESYGGYAWNGVSFRLGRFHLDDFGVHIAEHYRAGRTIVVPDVDADPRVNARERRAYQSAGSRAFVALPLRKNGKFVAVLGVVQDRPRDWLASDLACIEETAERTWAAVERARAEAALRQSEEKYRSLFERAQLALRSNEQELRDLLENSATAVASGGERTRRTGE